MSEHHSNVTRGDAFRNGSNAIVVTRVGTSWADIRVRQDGGATWTKRQPLPFPEDWEPIGKGTTR